MSDPTLPTAPTLIYSPVQPNCIITVYFQRQTAQFSYSCTYCGRGWEVHPDGSIYPPSTSRVVQFRVKGWQHATSFAGFQFACIGEDFPAKTKRWPPIPPSPLVDAAGVRFISGKQALTGAAVQYPPPPKELLSEVTFDFGSQKWSYRLAVLGANDKPTWDDPKIHDDGSE